MGTYNLKQCEDIARDPLLAGCCFPCYVAFGVPYMVRGGSLFLPVNVKCPLMCLKRNFQWINQKVLQKIISAHEVLFEYIQKICICSFYSRFTEKDFFHTSLNMAMTWILQAGLRIRTSTLCFFDHWIHRLSVV